MGLKDKVQQGDVTSASWANVTMADGILEALFGLEFGHADSQMTQIFFAAHLSPSTIEQFCGILLVRSKFFGMTF